MRVLKLFLIFLTALTSLLAQTSITPNGSGTIEDPYLIASLGNLFWITQDNERFDDHYRQINDIDADSTSSWFPDGPGNYEGWLPIGNDTSRFSGSYDGGGYTIDNLFIDRDSSNHMALFGYVFGANIHDLGLTNAIVRGRANVGGIVGEARYLTIEKCFVEGDITAYYSDAGGVVAALYPNSSISQCSFKGSVWSRKWHAGGITGYSGGCEISNCYNFGTIYSRIASGGIVGSSIYGASVNNCYNKGKVSGTYLNGAIVGENISASANNCFWDSQTSEQTGSQPGTPLTTEEMNDIVTYTAAGWDFDSTWAIVPVRNGGYPYLKWQTLPTIELFKVDNITRTNAQAHYYTDSNYVDQTSQIGVCWNTMGAPDINDSHSESYIIDDRGVYTTNLIGLEDYTDYYICAYMIDTAGIHYTQAIQFKTIMFDQMGTEEDPYQVSELKHLEWIVNNPLSWSKYFIQMNDINAGETRDWNDGSGWVSIGNHNNQFQGKYDGQNFTIDSLYINRENEEEVGLFGCIGGYAVLKNMRLTNFWIKGHDFIGGLVGRARQSTTSNNYPHIYNSFVNGFLEANRFAGLLVGDNGANIYDCVSYGRCQASYNIGGLIGSNYASIVRCQNYASAKGWTGTTGGLIGSNGGNIYFCVNRGPVDGAGPTGGLVGHNMKLISNCYNTGSVIGRDYIGGLVGTDKGAHTVNSYNTGYVYTPGTTIGGIVSLSYNDQNYHSYFTECFWDTLTSTVSSSFAGTGKSTGEMIDELIYIEAGWNFNTVWSIDWSINDGYPHLFWEANTPKVKIIRVEDIGADSAVVLCELFYLGDPHPDHYGLCWGQSEYPTMRDQLCDLGASDSTHKFYVTMKDLEENTKYYIRTFVDNFDGDTYGDTLSFTTLLVSLKDNIPDNYELEQNYPNPFNPITKLKYAIPEAQNVNMTIYDISGRQVETLVNEYQTAGSYSLIWDASNYSSGVYFYCLQTGSFTATRKMILMK